jgi:hypothetical protein
LSAVAIVPPVIAGAAAAIVAAPLAGVLPVRRSVGCLRGSGPRVGGVPLPSASIIAAISAPTGPYAAIGALGLWLGRRRKAAPSAARGSRPIIGLRRGWPRAVTTITSVATIAAMASVSMVVARILVLRQGHRGRHRQHGSGEQRCP